MLLKSWRVLLVDTGHMRRAGRAATTPEIVMIGMLQESSLMMLHHRFTSLHLNFHGHLHRLVVYRSSCYLELCVAQLNTTFAWKRLICSTLACCLHNSLPVGSTSGILVVHECHATWLRTLRDRATAAPVLSQVSTISDAALPGRTTLCCWCHYWQHLAKMTHSGP